MDPELDDSAWETLVLPNVWDRYGYEALDGIAWFRRTFELTAGEAEDGVAVAVGKVDDSDVTWVNGHEVGLAALRRGFEPVPSASVRDTIPAGLAAPVLGSTRTGGWCIMPTHDSRQT